MCKRYPINAAVASGATATKKAQIVNAPAITVPTARPNLHTLSFMTHLLEPNTDSVFIAQLMLMALILALATPVLARTATTTARSHHPNKQSNENDPNPVAL